MKRSKINLALAFMTTVVILSVIGTTAGTLAWYAYATRAILSFSGTSAYSSEQVQVGIHDSGNYLFNSETISSTRQFAQANDLTLDETRKIIWANPGQGLTGNVVSRYLNASPYATSILPPVTSLSRDTDDDLTLYRAPRALDASTQIEAEKSSYVKLPLCFQVKGSDNSNLPNHDVWLTGISAIDTSVEGLKYALRIFYENKYANTQYLLNPTSDSNTVGETVVAGTLDLKGDGTYDYDFNTRHEIVYGDYDGSIVYEANPHVAEEPNPLVDVNNTGLDIDDPDNASTFLSRHANGVYVADLSSMTLNTAKYETINTIAPLLDNDGYYYGGKPVAHTDPDQNNIAFTDLTIYIEGWDHSIINKVINASFNLGLQFEVNRL